MTSSDIPVTDYHPTEDSVKESSPTLWLRANSLWAVNYMCLIINKNRNRYSLFNYSKISFC